MFDGVHVAVLLTHEDRIFAYLLEGKREVFDRLDRTSRELAFMGEGAWEEVGRVVSNVVRPLCLGDVQEWVVCPQLTYV